MSRRLRKKTAIMAHKIVKIPNWDTDLNSEKIKGSRQNIITKVVLTTALPVVLTTLINISFSPLLNFLK